LFMAATGTATWAMADAGITMVGAEAIITVGDMALAGPCFLEAASPGGFFVHGCTMFGGIPWESPAASIASISLLSQRLTPMFRYC
jgi:hypothetical protein